MKLTTSCIEGYRNGDIVALKKIKEDIIKHEESKNKDRVKEEK